METVFAIVLLFTDWDQCYDYYHEKGLEEYAYSECTEVPKPSAAPATSIRPKARPEGLGQ